MSEIVEFEDIPDGYDLKGRVVEFDEPLLIYEFPPNREEIRDGKKVTLISIFPTDKLLFKTKYMLVEGGFGAVSYTSGRMLIGYFAPTPEDAAKKQNGQDGNTKLFPSRQSIKKYGGKLE